MTNEIPSEPQPGTRTGQPPRPGLALDSPDRRRSGLGIQSTAESLERWKESLRHQRPGVVGLGAHRRGPPRGPLFCLSAVDPHSRHDAFDDMCFVSSRLVSSAVRRRPRRRPRPRPVWQMSGPPDNTPSRVKCKSRRRLSHAWQPDKAARRSHRRCRLRIRGTRHCE